MNKPITERRARKPGRRRKQVNVSLSEPCYEELERRGKTLGKSVGSLVRVIVEGDLLAMAVKGEAELHGVIRLRPHEFDYTVDENGALEVWGIGKCGEIEWKIRVE